jgi:hypothetical protein
MEREPSKRKRKAAAPVAIKKEKVAVVPVKTTESLFAKLDSARLIKRMGSNHVSHPESSIVEYKRFLHLKIIDGDWNAIKLSPSPTIDTVWHLHVLDTKHYASECLEICGHVIHHDPDGGHDSAAQEIRYQRTLDLYKRTFLQDPPPNFWPATIIPPSPPAVTVPVPLHVKEEEGKMITLYVKDLNGRTFGVDIRTTATVLALKGEISKHRAFCPEDQRIIFAGTLLADDATLQSYNLHDKSTIFMTLRLSGC